MQSLYALTIVQPYADRNYLRAADNQWIWVSRQQGRQVCRISKTVTTLLENVEILLTTSLDEGSDSDSDADDDDK